MLADMGNALRPGLVKGKRKLVLAAAVFFAFSLTLRLAGNYRYGALLVALTYPEASVGMNPNGTRYNMSNILCDQVLEQAASSGSLGKVSANNLKSGLRVSSISRGRAGSGSGGTNAVDEELLTDVSADKTDGLVSTQFLLEFSGTSKTGFLKGDRAVRAVARSYRDWFQQQYCSRRPLDLSFEDMEAYDYPELKNYFSARLREICTFTNACYTRDKAFVSRDTGESFLSLNTKSWDIINTGLETLDAFVLSHGLSRDSRAYMDKLRYEHIRQSRSYLGYTQAYQVRLDAVKRFDNDMSTVMYIPTYDKDLAFYMSKTKIGIDYFSAEADQYSGAAAGLLESILGRKELLQKLGQQPGDQALYQQADQMAKAIRDQILALAETVNETALDYENSRSNDYVVVSEPESSLIGKYWKLFFLFPGVFFLLYWDKALGTMCRGAGSKEGGSKK